MKNKKIVVLALISILTLSFMSCTGGKKGKPMVNDVIKAYSGDSVKVSTKILEDGAEDSMIIINKELDGDIENIKISELDKENVEKSVQLSKKPGQIKADENNKPIIIINKEEEIVDLLKELDGYEPIFLKKNYDGKDFSYIVNNYQLEEEIENIKKYIKEVKSSEEYQIISDKLSKISKEIEYILFKGDKNKFKLNFKKKDGKSILIDQEVLNTLNSEEIEE